MLIFRKQNIRRWLDHVEIWCDDTWHNMTSFEFQTNLTSVYIAHRKLYYTAISMILFFVPVVVMAMAYVIIIIKLSYNYNVPKQKESCTEAHNRKRLAIINLEQLGLKVSFEER